MSFARLVTSLSPRLSRLDGAGNDCGLAYQRRCVSSWLAAGAEVASVNTPAEIEELRPSHPDVRFVPSDSAYHVVPGKPLVSVGEMLAVGRERADGLPYGLVNSDILFLGGREHLAAIAGFAKSGFVYGHRAEQARQDGLPGLPYLYGYDLVLLDPTLDYCESMADFAIGTPWWDYALLALLCESEAPGYALASPIISHLTHDQKWNLASWHTWLHRTVRLLAGANGGSAKAGALEAGALGSTWRYFCDYLDTSLAAGHLAEGFAGHFGPVFGMALVDFIRRRTTGHVWFPERLDNGTLLFDAVPVCRLGWWRGDASAEVDGLQADLVA